jgi:hypothetical protein
MVDTITRYMRESEVIFTGNSLCPDKFANIFLDDTPINTYCQRGNPLILTSANNAANLRIGVGIVNTSTNAYAKVLSTSNNIVYIDQNYLTLKINPYAANTLSSTDYKVDDVVYQSSLVPSGTVAPVYTSTWKTYSSFLNTYGVWENNQTALGTYERTYAVTFPAGASYQYAFAADDSGSFYLDGSLISNTPSNWAVTPSYISLSITSGVHILRWVGTNTGGPGSIGLHIKTTAGATVFSSRNPPNVSRYDDVATFQGRVQYYDVATKTLAVLPERGMIDINPDLPSSTIKRIKGTVLCNVSSLVSGNVFPLNSTVKETTNASNSGIISAYSHYSGTIAYQSNSSSYIYTQANLSSSLIGSTVTFTSGSIVNNSGVVRQILSISDNTAIQLNSAVSGLTSNSRYSIGTHTVDDYGVVSGIFNIPETETANFKAGERLFTITDTTTSSNNFYRMRATGSYKVTGAADPISSPVSPVNASNPIVSTRISRSTKAFDPIAQTFYVPEANTAVSGEISTSYGMYISSVDLWFSGKPTNINEQAPVIVRIVTVENDLPTANVIAESVVECRNVNTSTTPIAFIPSAIPTTSSNTSTKFKFSDPVYLNTGATYAITITSDSPYYSVFVAELGGSVIGSSPSRRVSTQPYVGDFFKAQNASTWSPILNTDLMFRINKCVFNANSLGTVVFKPKNVYSNVNIDTLLVHSSEINQKPTGTKYKIKANNVFGVADPEWFYLQPNSPYNYGGDLSTSTKSSGRRRVLTSGDSASMNVGVELISTDSSVSPIISKERISAVAFENIINDAELSNTIISITSGGRHANIMNTIVTFSSPDDPAGLTAAGYAQLIGTISNSDIIISDAGSYTARESVVITFSAPDSAVGTKANAYINATGAGSIIISNIIVDNPGSGYVNSVPTITFSSGTTTATANIRSNISSIVLTSVGSGYYTNPTITIAENNSTGWGATANATAAVAGETGASGGNCLVRYITKRVDLASGFDAGDLRVYLDCIRPRGTNINVYYKVKADSDTESFDSKKWQLMNKVSDSYSPDQKTVIELEFRPNLLENILSYTENGTVYPLGGKFKQFSIKVVMTSADTTVVPAITNFSAIATPSG